MTNHPLLYLTAAAHVGALHAKQHYRKVRAEMSERPEAGEGMVGWLIIIVAVAAIALWAVGAFTGEVETKVETFDLQDSAAG